MAWRPPDVGARATWTRTFSADDVELYARITGDRNPLHFDAAFAARTKFGRLVVQGGLTTGLLHALVAMDMPGPGNTSATRALNRPVVSPPWTISRPGRRAAAKDSSKCSGLRSPVIRA